MFFIKVADGWNQTRDLRCRMQLMPCQLCHNQSAKVYFSLKQSYNSLPITGDQTLMVICECPLLLYISLAVEVLK